MSELREVERLARKTNELSDEIRQLKAELRRVSNSATGNASGFKIIKERTGGTTGQGNAYIHPVTTLLYGALPQVRLQYDTEQYVQYDELGRFDFGSDPQQKQASIYARRGATGGASDYPSDIIFEIINDGGTAMVTIAEFLYSNRVNLNGLTTINAQNGDADLLVLQDRDTTVHTFEIDGDITVEAASNAGMQFIYNNTQNSGTAGFAEFIAAITPVTASTPLVTMGASISGYNGSYLGNYAWIHAQQRDLYLVANGVEADDQAIHFGTGAGSTAITSRGNVNASGLVLSTGARLNEFSTDGTLAGDSDVAAPTEKAVKAYVDTFERIGSGNADLLPTSFIDGTNYNDLVEWANSGASAMNLKFKCDEPPLRSGLSLYISGLEIDIANADANDFIDTVNIYALAHNAQTSKYSDTASNVSTVGRKVSGTDFDAVTPFDASTYRVIFLQIIGSNTTAADLEIRGVWLKGYYA